MSQLLENFKPGPLDIYRTKASFDWKKLKLFFDTEDIVKYEVRCNQDIDNPYMSYYYLLLSK